MNVRVRSSLKKSINDAAKEINKELVPAMSERYALKGKSKVKNMLDLKKAEANDLSAAIRAYRRKYGLSNFQVSPARPNPKRRPQYVRAKVLNESPMDALTYGEIKAFVTRFKSGHVAVAERVPGETMRSKPKKQKIAELFGPAPISMARVAFERSGINKDEILRRCIQNHMDTLFSRKMKG